MSKRTRIVAITAALALAGAAFASQAASADTVPVMPAYLSNGLAECKAQLAVATTTSDRAWGNTCVRLAQRAIDAWTKANPTPTPTATATPSPTATPTPTPTPTATPTPTVPPTTTPPPTTPAGIGSFATGPAAGAGLPPGTALVPLQGRLQANSTYTGVAIPASALGTVTVSGLTLRNCTLAAGVVFTGNNVTVDHCTIHGGVSLSGGDNFVFTGNEVTGWDDGLHITSDSGPVNGVKVAGNWIHLPSPTCADHSDGVQLLGVAAAVFTNNVIDLGHWISCGSDPGDGPLNGAFQIENTQGPVSGVTVSGNLLNGGGFTFRAYAGTKLDAVTGNGFGPDAQFGPADTKQATIGTWTDNYDVATGKPVLRE
jgi:hypothetical protein